MLALGFLNIKQYDSYRSKFDHQKHHLEMFTIRVCFTLSDFPRENFKKETLTIHISAKTAHLILNIVANVSGSNEFLGVRERE